MLEWTVRQSIRRGSFAPKGWKKMCQLWSIFAQLELLKSASYLEKYITTMKMLPILFGDISLIIKRKKKYKASTQYKATFLKQNFGKKLNASSGAQR